MTTKKTESPFDKAWKRLKKNYPAVVSLGVIMIAIFIAIFAAIIAPDTTPNANDQVLELSNQNPGFSIEMLKIRKNRPPRKSWIIGNLLNGKDNPFTLVPITKYRFDSMHIIVDVYRGTMYDTEPDTFDLVDVVYSFQPEKLQIDEDGDKLVFTDNSHKANVASIKSLQETIKNKHVFVKKYKLGTDKFGRDILSRLFFGLRVSLSVGFIAVMISLFIGITIGASAGYFRNDKIKVSNASKIAAIVTFLVTITLLILGVNIGIVDNSFVSAIIGFASVIGCFILLRVGLKLLGNTLTNKSYFKYDDIIMWVINVVWSIPTILLAMALSFALGRWLESFWVIYIAVGLSMWVDVARIIRGQVMAEREMEYVQAARALGYSNFRNIFRHILPNIMGPLMVIMAANFAEAILIEAGLSFIGIGVQPPKPSLGNMLSEYRNYLRVPGKAFMALTPGFGIMILVLSFNLIGNGLRDAFDVKGKIQ